jgi:hypothetical protein
LGDRDYVAVDPVGGPVRSGQFIAPTGQGAVEVEPEGFVAAGRGLGDLIAEIAVGNRFEPLDAQVDPFLLSLQPRRDGRLPDRQGRDHLDLGERDLVGAVDRGVHPGLRGIEITVTHDLQGVPLAAEHSGPHEHLDQQGDGDREKIVLRRIDIPTLNSCRDR